MTDKTLGGDKEELPPKSVRTVESRVVVGREIVTGTPKSTASKRTLQMPEEVVEVLPAARRRQAEDQLAFGAGCRNE